MEKLDKYLVIKNMIMALLISSGFFACVGDIGTTLRSEEANRLLSGDSIKYWLRNSRVENGSDIDINSCEESVALGFLNLATEADTMFYLYQFPSELCGDAESTLIRIKAVYELESDINSNFEDQINLSEQFPEGNEISNIEVIDLTTRHLKLKYTQGENEIIEVFDGSAQNQRVSFN